ncbi:MAG: DUF4384 domain-containing protein [Sulfuricellaceae bacterium]
MKTTTPLAFALAFFWFGSTVSAASGETFSARALFNTGGTSIMTGNKPAAPAKPAEPSFRGVKFWIEKETAGGKVAVVPASTVFRGGEAIRLVLKSNADGFIYVYNQGTAGGQMLFPSRVLNDADKLVRAGDLVTIPSNGFMKFDGNRGVEKILVAVSSRPLSPPMVQAAQPDRVIATLNANAIQARNFNFTAADQGSAANAPGFEPAGYAVAPEAAFEGGSRQLVLTLELKHE